MPSSQTPSSIWTKSTSALLNLRWLVWASLVSQVVIVVTGGLVRLTGSGLGCPTWPKCTSQSLVTVPEQGLHGVIEFGNRLLTFVLLVVAALTLLAAWRFGRQLLRLAVALLLGIVVQAGLGGITVLIKLNPWIVGAHFVVSAVLIAIASVLVWRYQEPKASVVTPFVRGLTPITSVAGSVAILVGVLVTGAGPHAGDSAALRNGLDLEIWQHYHSYPGYLLLVLLATTSWMQWRTREISSVAGRITLATLLVCVAQAGIGVAQSRLGVPAGLVGFHLLLAAILCSLITFNHLSNRSL